MRLRQKKKQNKNKDGEHASNPMKLNDVDIIYMGSLRDVSKNTSFSDLFRKVLACFFSFFQDSWVCCYEIVLKILRLPLISNKWFQECATANAEEQIASIVSGIFYPMNKKMLWNHSFAAEHRTRMPFIRIVVYHKFFLTIWNEMN